MLQYLVLWPHVCAPNKFIVISEKDSMEFFCLYITYYMGELRRKDIYTYKLFPLHNNHINRPPTQCGNVHFFQKANIIKIDFIVWKITHLVVVLSCSTDDVTVGPREAAEPASVLLIVSGCVDGKAVASWAPPTNSRSASPLSNTSIWM